MAETSYICVHGIVHHDGTSIAVHVFHFDYAYCGINRPKGNPFGIFYIVVFVTYP